MNMHVIDVDFDMARETARQTRLHKIERAAGEVQRQALLSIGASLPEYHDANMNASFLQLADAMGYAVRLLPAKEAA